VLDVLVVPVLRDNYTYLVVDEPTRTCLIIDPPEVGPVLSKLEQDGLSPKAIWLTHHHADHIAGVPGIVERFPGLPVVCSQRDATRIPSSTRSVKEGDTLDFGGEEAEVLALPGHAEGHIAFHFRGSHHLFCGDVIFGASCGAVFGNTHSEMYHSVTRVSELPPETRLWCGHEYTENNLRFAEAVLGSQALEERKKNFKKPSVPLLLSIEHRTNPFMRLQSPEVLKYVAMESGDPEATFKALRLAKDRF
jgi:hydroxyacylglutathione hydrolase